MRQTFGGKRLCSEEAFLRINIIIITQINAHDEALKAIELVVKEGN